MTSHAPGEIWFWNSSWAFRCDLDIPSIYSPAVELGDGSSGGAPLCHLDKGKAPGAARNAVCDEVHRGNLAYFAEQLEQGGSSCSMVQVAYV